ncbi:hypothetical protein HK097_001113, partial [Rhizophlyctis rosea]
SSFARKHDLQRHTRTLHSGTRPFECPNCKMGFNRADALRRHRMQEDREAQLRARNVLMGRGVAGVSVNREEVLKAGA